MRRLMDSRRTAPVRDALGAMPPLGHIWSRTAR
mgnify:CR=1 FL=1